MTAWLVKTEPGSYSYDDLERDGTTYWDGVTSPMAQMNMRAMQVGDAAVVYHSQSDKAAIGLAEVTRGPYPDPTDDSGRRVWVDIKAVRRLDRPVTLTELKSEPAFAASMLVRQSRLSVVALDNEQLAIIERLAGT
jgi:predicted RNA-binding protein with PUA-like domain